VNPANDNPPDILAHLREVMERMSKAPPAPVFCASYLFGNDQALRFQHEGVDYLIAGHGFWLKIPPDVRAPRGSILDRGIEIHNLDRDDVLQEKVFGLLSTKIQESFT
jgi:hypothetical protein